MELENIIEIIRMFPQLNLLNDLKHIFLKLIIPVKVTMTKIKYGKIYVNKSLLQKIEEMSLVILP